jgi:hypothetical protein
MKKGNLNLLFLLVIIGLIISGIWGISPVKNKIIITDRELITQSGVCPPFYLYDEDGNIIDPVKGLNADKPYSPKQTCGKCHDYDKITEGYHFQQGKDETASGALAERYQWVSHPGNYGGNWCSPAPLYNYLSDKNNSSAKEMDMTSFTFITNGCGTCHPGGGSLEYDREGFRYDRQMEKMGYKAGGTNDFDGDYYQAHWNRSGVIEADCNLCHQPDYDYKTRNEHLAKFNFKWMATAGTGLATVEGSIRDTVDVKVKYNLTKFGADGKISMHLVREPRNETCLNCHSKPQWKKRGSSFTEYTDVHISKGLKCVDCHVAGSMASDPRITGKEVHQFGKGDDPSGWVRNDLDNTLRSCNDCHTTGYLNAPVAKHSWLPDLHLDKLSCQACHIPQRKVKSALVQVSDAYNPGTKISPPPKYVWTFYDQNMNYWNHYGELNMFTAKDQPSDPFVPVFAKYKGQIFPVNAVHSAWPGIYTEGEKGLNQPKMRDIYAMWTIHRNDNSKYPDLAKITDNNSDMIPEVNTSEEVDAFINSVTAYMNDQGYDLSGRKIVWVNNDRMYLSGTEYQMLDKEYWESSPYASVYKYSHDVFPAKAGLGINGCTDCHSFGSDMFFRRVVKYPFGDDGYPVTEPQYKKLGMSGFMMGISAFREQIVKSFTYPAILFLLFTILISVACHVNRKENFFPVNSDYLCIVYGMLAAGVALIFLKPDVNSYILPDRMTLDSNHFIITIIALIAGSFTWLMMKKEDPAGSLLSKLQALFLILAVISGMLMMIRFDLIYQIVRIAYTVFDLAVLFSICISIIYLIKNQFRNIETNMIN